jgi:hypothetical protein
MSEKKINNELKKLVEVYFTAHLNFKSDLEEFRLSSMIQENHIVPPLRMPATNIKKGLLETNLDGQF